MKELVGKNLHVMAMKTMDAQEEVCDHDVVLIDPVMTVRQTLTWMGN